MNYLSVFSGIEAASIAWGPLGFQALGFSEIDPFPCAVLNYRFPAITNYGDIRNYREWKIGKAVDVVVGGSPCQSYSIAGNRRGSQDERGRLMFAYGNLVDYFRPRWVVWENVPGVLSSNRGLDFAEFICMLGKYGYGLAWRILDARYFGVPQRRRRVFVVGYSGDVRRPAAVLFDAYSGGGNTAAVESEGGPSPGIDKGAGAAIYNIHQHDARITKAENVIDTVTGLWGTGGNNVPLCLMDQGGAVMRAEYGIAGTLRANEHQHNPIVFSKQAYNVYAKNETASTLLENCYKGADRTDLVMDGGGALLRRITPREAERVQGFPDDWTRVPYRRHRAEACPDGPRYKAIGNSMAVPVMRWLGRRIMLAERIFGGG